MVIGEKNLFLRKILPCLEGEGYEYIFASTIDAGLDMYSTKTAIQLVLVQEKLDSVEYIEVPKALRTKSAIPIVVFSEKPSVIQEILSLSAGVNDYLHVNSHPEVIRWRVHNAAYKEKQEVVNFCDIQVDRRSQMVHYLDKEVHLKPQEYQLLLFLYRNSGRAIPRSEILDKVWGSDYFGSDRTVDIHVKCLRKKIPSLAESLKTVHGIGYLLLVPRTM